MAEKDYFKYCDAFVILTRQGLVLTSNDACITPEEDSYLSEINRRMVERKEQQNEQKKSKTGTENGFRVIKDAGIELSKQRAKGQAKVFQFQKTRRGGRRK